MTSQEIERIFKMRQQFKECRVPQEQQRDSESSNYKEESARISEISELIRKFKD